MVHSAKAANDQAIGELSPDRIQEIAGFLPEQPEGWGRPISDRAFWSDPNIIQLASRLTKSADSYLDQPLPAWDDDAYLEFSRVGTRPNGEKMEGRRAAFLEPLVVGECVENQGRYLAKINEILEAYAKEPTWTLPAHDRDLACYNRRHYEVDLRTSTFGLELAEALYLLGDKIDPAVRSDLTAALNQRLIDPIRETLATGKGNSWLGSSKSSDQNNWNAVCLSGVVGGALILLPDKSDRALFVALGEHYSTHYLNSYTADGYCEEGAGYWSYGMERYVVLREEMLQATGGRIDLFSDPRVVAMALYGARIRIGAKAVPCFGDCRFGTTPDVKLLAYCNDVLGLGLKMDPYEMERGGGRFVDIFLKATPCATAAKGGGLREDPLRTFFAKAGVLTCRPDSASTCKLGIGIKAGGNGSHSHNDIGSYSIAVGDDEPTGDPGGPLAYDSKTFGPHRYDYKILNSFGHPVPVVAGQLQIVAAQARPKVLSTSFTPTRDEIKMDITSAYRVPVLKQLIRTMDYSRDGAGEVDLVDEVTFSSASSFEEALVTHGDWKQIDPNTIMMSLGQGKIMVTIAAPDGFTVKSEQITELGAHTFTRLGLVFNNPVTTAKVSMTFKPVL
jgi:hypothetical protein